MSATLTVSNLHVGFGARVLFSGLDLTLTDGDVTAIVGPNGSGKSSLMRTIVGELPIESGSITRSPPDATIAWLPQVAPDDEETLLAYCRRRTGVEGADRELGLAAAAIAAGEQGADDRYSLALHRWLSLGAADLDERLPEVAAAVGLTVDPGRAHGSLSGGQAARAALVAVLLSQFDVLLLDEPTNNLDARGLRLMADFVRGRPGPVLVASHDRDWLDEVTTSVVELDLPQQRIAHYTGGYSDLVAQRTLARAQAWRAYGEYAAERDSLRAQSRQRHEWADRGRRNVAQGNEPDKHIREKHRARADRQGAKGARLERAADRLDGVEQPRREWNLRYTIAEGRPSSDVVATLSEAVVVRGEFVLGPASLALGRGDRVAITGDNGGGKTTLIQALLGELTLTSGRQSLGTRVAVGLIDQRRDLLDVGEPLSEVARAALVTDPATSTQWDPAAVRTLLAKFGLGAAHVQRPARSLSMGERTRAMMAIFQGREVNLLVLDEPTNHVDVDGIEQLEAAVAAFTGTVLVVSHDESLLRGIRLTHRWNVRDGHVHIDAR
ncbi:hypothetical protein BA895_14000 [Humibacillus sp. DSM 29435]|uniref:ABC-F family ATP-binding cassette domain-containing protein n=1 Tax=Humibacillus sp. DSM 29435 TaxID=1869167 RepID=UPI00087271D5|nr:ABC-F family ATP-binding cassette domain-containing protein [Humibacillus sp. DSM 29435]OFE17896.1 hypothetical protein BA895_14000 [Humibacillus sp. DSM 29435]